MGELEGLCAGGVMRYNPRPSGWLASVHVLVSEGVLMDYMQAVRFAFRGPRPWINLLMIVVGVIIPFIGVIVTMGYAVVVEKAIVSDRNSAPPEFNFSYFTLYLQRGIGPFLVGLVAALLMMPMGAVMYLIFLLVAQYHHGIAALVVIGVLELLWMGVVVVINLVLVPMRLKAGFDGFKAAFDFAFALDYLRRLIGPLVLTFFALGLISFVVTLLGFIACCVGVYLSIAVMTLVNAHVGAQLYLLYLSRGGRDLHVIPDQLGAYAPAFPVVQE